jgi:hypothetical protein
MSSLNNSSDHSPSSPITGLEDHAEFLRRHIGLGETDIKHMLDALGLD